MRRSNAVDFFRGLGLWMLFLDHLKPNVWSHLTLSHFGPSDFAEVFVFLSGYVSTSMYERAFHSGGITSALEKLRTRVTKIYLAHILSMAAGLAILAAFAFQGFRMDDSFLYAWMEDPLRYLSRALLLLYTPGLFTLLPLYVLLSPLAMVAVFAMRRWPAWVLASSFAVWCLAQTGTFDFPALHDTWVFLPFAWQFLLILGIASKIYWADVKRMAQSRVLQVLAFTVVLLSFLLRMVRFLPFTQPYAHLLAYNNSKTHLAPFRLVHFLSLLVLVIAIPWAWKKWLETWPARLAIAAGRDSLFIYSITLVLAVLLNLLLKGLHGGPLLQLACCALGLVLICGIADWRNKVPARLNLQPEESRE